MLLFKTRLAELIARQEGFFRPGTVPSRLHNPGDLRHGPGATHSGDPNGIGTYTSDASGAEDLERQLRLYAGRGMSLRDCIYVYAPPSENGTEGYLSFVTKGLGLPPETPVSVALTIPAQENNG